MTRRVITIINEFARTLDIREGLQQVPAHALQRGDILSGTGESVVAVQRGARTPSGKSEVVLEKNGYRRMTIWNSGTKVTIQARSSPPVPPARSEDASFGEMPGKARQLLERAVLEGLSRSEALQRFMVEGFSTQTAARIIAAHASKFLQRDGVGTPEEVAYGEGWHSTENANPYTSAAERASWERGRAAKKLKFKTNSNARREGEMAPGMKRGVGFQPPKKRIADYKSEKGYVAKLIDVKTGGVLARSEPHISNGEGLKKWIMGEAQKLIARGKRVKAEVSVEFFDPNLMSN